MRRACMIFEILFSKTWGYKITAKNTIVKLSPLRHLRRLPDELMLDVGENFPTRFTYVRKETFLLNISEA